MSQLSPEMETTPDTAHVSEIKLPKKSSQRRTELKEIAEQFAMSRDKWIERNQYFYDQDLAYMKFLVPEGKKVLEVGCGIGNLLAGLKPAQGLGLDFSETKIARAKDLHSNLSFVVADAEDNETLASLQAEQGKFDFIILSDTLGYLDDCQTVLHNLHQFCHEGTRIVLSYYSHLWEPILKLGEQFHQKMPSGELNWLSSTDIANLLDITDFEVVSKEWRQLLPKRLAGIGSFVNRFIAPLPLIRRFCLRHYVVGKPIASKIAQTKTFPSCSVVVPCRNESGNIQQIMERIPVFCPELEVVFVEGHSQDDTWNEIQRIQREYPQRMIKSLQQPGKGKADAVQAAFKEARGDVLMILDADMTVPPEDLPKFYHLIRTGKGEFINGTRMIYPMENQAMQFLNFWANRTFSLIFSYLLNQRFTDTLCGTKVLTKASYDAIVENRSYFGDFDPFGDFDLIFGAAKLNLKIVEVPTRYASRVYGTTQISRFSHGWLLLRMVLFAFRKLKMI